jgi:hypothetical protein
MEFPLPCTLCLVPWLCLLPRGRSHARARRRFRDTTSRAPSLAHVLCAVHRLRILIPGTATNILRFLTQNKYTFSRGYPATDIRFTATRAEADSEYPPITSPFQGHSGWRRGPEVIAGISFRTSSIGTVRPLSASAMPRSMAINVSV